MNETNSPVQDQEVKQAESFAPRTWLTRLREKKIGKIAAENNKLTAKPAESVVPGPTDEEPAEMTGAESDVVPETTPTSNPEAKLGRVAVNLAKESNDVVAKEESKNRELNADVRLAYQALGGLEDMAPSLGEESGVKIPFVETLGSKVSKEMALEVLLEATQIYLADYKRRQEPDNNLGTGTGAQKALQFCEDHQDIWDLLPSHQKIWVQLNFEKTVRRFAQRASLFDTGRNVAEAIGASGTLKDAFENIVVETNDSMRSTLSDTLAHSNLEKMGKNLQTLLDKNKGDINILIVHLEKHMGSLDSVLAKLPDSELKTYLTSVYDEISEMMPNLKSADSGEKRRAAMQIIKYASDRLTYIGTMLNTPKDSEFRGTTPFMQKLHADLPGGTVATVFWEGFKRKNILGRANAEVVRSTWQSASDIGGLIEGDRGAAMVAENSPTTLRGAERQTIHVAERVAELMKTMASLREMNLTGENVTSKQVLDAAKKMQELRRAVPLLDQIQQIAQTGDLAGILGVMDDEIPDEIKTQIVEASREFYPQADAEIVEGEVVAEEEVAPESDGKLGQELLVTTVVDRIVVLYDVSEEDARAMIEADSGQVENWYKRRESGSDKRGIAGIHQKLTRGLRRFSVDKLGTPGSLSPAEQMGVQFVDGEIVLSESAQAMAGALERLSKLTGPEATIKGMDTEQLRKDLALVNHLVMKAGDASFGKKVRELIRGEAVLTSLKTMGIADKAQAFLENGSVLIAEVGAVVGVGLLASQASEVGKWLSAQAHNLTGGWLSHAQAELQDHATKLGTLVTDYDSAHVIEDARESVEKTLEQTRDILYKVNINYQEFGVWVDGLQQGAADFSHNAMEAANTFFSKTNALDVSTKAGKAMLGVGAAISVAITEAIVHSKAHFKEAKRN